MKKILLLILSSLLFSGCYYTELNDLSIVDSVGIDYKEERYIVTMSVVNTLEYKSEEDMQTNLYTSSGKTIEDAFQNFYLEINKTIYLDSLNNLLLSDQLQEKQLEEIVDFFLDNEQSRNTFNVIYVKNSKMKDILDNNINLKSLLMTNSKEFGNSFLYSFEDFYKDNSSYSFVPTIYYKNKIIVDNYSVFQKYKYIDCLNKEESIVYNLLQKRIKNLRLNIDDTYFNVTDIRVNILNNKNPEIYIYSVIDKDKKDIYENYLKKNINHILKKYKLYKHYHLKIKTKQERKN